MSKFVINMEWDIEDDDIVKSTFVEAITLEIDEWIKEWFGQVGSNGFIGFLPEEDDNENQTS